MFIQKKTYVNLLLFLECALRLEHVGLNNFFLTYLQSYNDMFHNASYSTGGGGNSGGAKINDSLGPPGVRPPGYAPEVCHNLGRVKVFTPKGGIRESGTCAPSALP